jgi:hypothetical protein
MPEWGNMDEITSEQKPMPLEYSNAQARVPPPRFVRAMLRLLIIVCALEIVVHISRRLAESLAGVNLTRTLYLIVSVGYDIFCVCNLIIGIVGANLMLRGDAAGRRMVRFWAWAQFVLMGVLVFIRIVYLASRQPTYLGYPISNVIYGFFYVAYDLPWGVAMPIIMLILLRQPVERDEKS